MTDLLSDIETPSDAELISRVRGGDVAAYGELFSRHKDAANRLARQLVRGPDADDLVSESFAKVLQVLQGGGGPDVAFRAYLLTAVRRLHVDRMRAGAKLQTSDDMTAFDPGVPFQDTAVAAFESGAAARAFASLPERWQLVLWHLEVEGQKPADIAPLLGMSANSVSALAYRAREGLRQAFLTMHLNDISETDCRWVNEHLGAYVRHGLSNRDSTKVQSHLDQCRRCTAMYLELNEVNSNLAAIIAPLLLGAAAAGYLASSGAAAAGGLGLVSSVFGRVRDTVTANAGAATAGAVAAGVAAAATAGIMLLPSGGDDNQDVVGADEPIGITSTPPGATPGPGDKKTDDQPGETVTSPAAVLPTVLPSPSGASSPSETAESPGASPSDGTSPSGGTSPTDSPTSGPTDGPTSGPTSGPTDGPTDGPTSGPTEGPTDGPTTGPTEGPTEGPTPTEPTPTEEPTTPPVTYEVTVGPATISDGQVTFDLIGDPLPPKVYLSLRSEPAGITFDPLGDGTCVYVDPVTAECDTSTSTSLVMAPFARALTTALGGSFTVSMPLAGTPTVDTLVTVTLSAPEGLAPQTVTALYDVKEPDPTADVALSAPGEVSVTDDVLDYSFQGTVSGVPDGYTGGATFSLQSQEGRAGFSGSGTPGCRVSDAGTIVCDSIRNGAVDFSVHVKDNSVPTELTLRLEALEGVKDPVEANNVATVTLLPFRPAADVSLTVESDIEGNAGKGTLTASVADAPADQVVLTASYDPLGVTFTAVPDSCEFDNGLVTCDRTGPTVAPLDFDVELVERPGADRPEVVTFKVTAPAYFDPDEVDNTVAIEIARKLGNDVVEVLTENKASSDSVMTAARHTTSSNATVTETSSTTVREQTDRAVLRKDAVKRTADKLAAGKERREQPRDRKEWARERLEAVLSRLPLPSSGGTGGVTDLR